MKWDVNSKEQYISSLLDDIDEAGSTGTEFIDEMSDIGLSDEVDKIKSLSFNFGDQSREGLEKHHVDSTANGAQNSKSKSYRKQLRLDVAKYLSTKSNFFPVNQTCITRKCRTTSNLLSFGFSSSTLTVSRIKEALPVHSLSILPLLLTSFGRPC